MRFLFSLYCVRARKARENRSKNLRIVQKRKKKQSFFQKALTNHSIVGKMRKNGRGKMEKEYVVSYHETELGGMADFHSHEFYEITLLLAGNVASLLADRAVEGDTPRLVLTAPGAPHFMRVLKKGGYRRINFNFSRAFLENYVPEWRSLVRVFGEYGNILPLGDEECQAFREMLFAIKDEENAFRARLLTLLLLSRAAELGSAVSMKETTPPVCVIEALAYISSHYAEPIVAGTLASRLGVGRTTLMTAFHRYTGATLVEHLTRTRVRMAETLLGEGYTLEDVADRVGFGSGSGLIRAFKRVHGVTPRTYLKNIGARVGSLYKPV